MARVSLMNGFKRWSAVGVVALSLVGCGSALDKVQTELKSFQCSSSDFSRIEKAVISHLGERDFSSNSSEVYSLFKTMNAALVERCETAVLSACSPEHTSNKSKDTVIGPVNDLGITASVRLIEVRRHDGLARSPEPMLIYSSKLDYQEFKNGVACYRKHAR